MYNLMSLKLRVRNQPSLPQWDAVDTGPDLRCQNVLTTFETAIRHNRRTTQTELEKVFCRWIYFHLHSKIFFWPSYGGRSPPSPLWPATVCSRTVG